MSKTFHKELSGIKTQQVAALKHSNERHLHGGNMIQVTFYDTLQGVDDETVEMLN